MDQLTAKRQRWHHFRKREDFVAMEIQAAAELKLPIIPVLFDGASMPTARQLPREIALLPSLNASLISDGKAFRVGVDAICDQIAKLRRTYRDQNSLDAGPGDAERRRQLGEGKPSKR